MLETKKKLIIVVDEKTSTYGELLSALITMNDDKIDDNGNLIENGIVGTRDGSVETVVWTEKVYADNQAQLGSNNKILFIGKNDASKPIILNISFENYFNKFGIYYGYLGNKSVIFADKKSLVTNKSLYNEFFDAYSEFILSVGTEYTNSQKIQQANLIEDFKIKRRERLLAIMNKGIDGINKGFKTIQKAPELLKKNSAPNDQTTEFTTSEPMAKSNSLIPQATTETAVVTDTAIQTAKIALPVFWPQEIVEQITMGIVRVKSGKEILDQQYRCGTLSFYIQQLAKFME